MGNERKTQEKEEPLDILELTTTVKYLNCSSNNVQKAVEQVVLNVHSMAAQTAELIQKNRDLLSDVTDHLDGILSSHLNITQTEEIKEIIRIGEELSGQFDKKIQQLVFSGSGQVLDEKKRILARRESELKRREKELEKEIHKRVMAVREDSCQEVASANELLLNTLKKTETVLDQKKITRFVYSTISKFQGEFTAEHVMLDVDYLSKLFLQTIKPFQQTKKVVEKGGKCHEIVVNTLSDSRYQDLFFFFCKYYYELLDLYKKEGRIPPVADEETRIFKSREKNVRNIIANMQKR